MAAIVNTIKTTIAENFGGAAHSLAPAGSQFALAEVPDQADKVAVVTGGSRGIGYACAHTLLEHNIKKLYVIASSDESIDGAKSSISESLGSTIAAKVKWFQADLGDWSAIPGIAKQITDSTDRLDILINDAARGIMTYQVAPVGVDRHMAVNHFGHVILTSHLLPLLKKTAKSYPDQKVRIVTLGSNAHQGTPSDTHFASLEELNRDLGPNGQYGRSKLAQMLYAKYLGKHLTSSIPNLLANSVHPGFVETKQSTVDIHEPYPVAGFGVSTVLNPIKKDQWMGCVSAMFAATKTEGTGQYICPPAIVEQGSSQFQDEKLMEQLMKLTEELVREKTDAVKQGCPLTLY